MTLIYIIFVHPHLHKNHIMIFSLPLWEEKNVVQLPNTFVLILFCFNLLYIINKYIVLEYLKETVIKLKQCMIFYGIGNWVGEINVTVFTNTINVWVFSSS